jgi:tetratricopeptide (TPR) repeat protein
MRSTSGIHTSSGSATPNQVVSQKASGLKLPMNIFLEFENRAFKFGHVVDILHQMSKFDPMVKDDDVIDLSEDKDGDCPKTSPSSSSDNSITSKTLPKTNRIGKPMGSNTPRPLGQKAAKKLAKGEAKFSSLADSEDEKVQALKEMAAAHVRLAASIELNNQQQALKIQQEALKNNKDALYKEFKMAKELGDMEEARKVLQKMKTLNEASVSAPFSPAQAAFIELRDNEKVDDNKNDDNREGSLLNQHTI